MKKRTIVKLLALILLILGVVWYCRGGLFFVRIAPDAEGSVVYINEYTGVSFEDELTAEETDAVVKVLNGKAQYSGFLTGIPSCGFDGDIAIIIDGVRYAVARDTCGTLQVCHTLHYIDISNEEVAVLHEIFEKRGGTFPCI